MYENYERRVRPSAGTRLRRLAAALSLALLAAACLYAWANWGKVPRPVAEADGIKQVSTVEDAHLAVYDGARWREQFWNGVNLGATLPGHAPGELAPAKEDYLKWFAQMKEMNVDVVRVYTILSPEFYEAVEEFNSTREDPLWVVQGVWSPEEKLIGETEEGNDAYRQDITDEFHAELRDAVHAVHGDAELPRRYGHASGDFGADISRYTLGWMLGTEWYPYAVKATNDANAGMEPFSGEYFQATGDASPFESWLAEGADVLAREEMEYGWQHPVSFTNWLTTDPLSHPNEPNPKEDLAPVDPMHVEPTDRWRAGYFAAFHVYPYYPDFLRYEQKCQNYTTADGRRDPYAGYLNELRDHHQDIPLVVAEFGVPSSRGMAHRGPLGRGDQGLHTEEEQGHIDAAMLEDMRQEGYDGGFLFAWQDEWFKFTWNTADLSVPPERRPMWFNRLTNEQNFGVIANEPDEKNEIIRLDGETEDWEEHGKTATRSYPDFDLSVAHDAAYLYLLARKRDGAWTFPEDELDVGFGTLPGGSETAGVAPGLSFPDGGVQTLLKLRGKEGSRMYINSAFDYHTWMYGHELGQIPGAAGSPDPEDGEFLPWKLALSREIVLPQTQKRIPFDEVDIGVMKPGISDPDHPSFDSLADWYARGDVLEVRIPWMMLGFTDPSQLRVWDNLYEAGEVSPVKTDGVRVYPASKPGESAAAEVEPLRYSWSGWSEPDFHERKKQSYYVLREAYENKRLEPPEE